MAIKGFSGYLPDSVSEWTFPGNLIDGNYSNYCRFTGRQMGYYTFSLLPDEVNSFRIRVKNYSNTSNLRFQLAFGDDNTQTQIGSEVIYNPQKNELFVVPFDFTAEQKSQILTHRQNLLFGLTEQKSYMTGSLSEIDIEVPNTNKVYVGDTLITEVYLGETKASAVYVGTTKVL